MKAAGVTKDMRTQKLMGVNLEKIAEYIGLSLDEVESLQTGYNV